jgi:transcriptional regulator with XRE-family HTH domain
MVTIQMTSSTRFGALLREWREKHGWTLREMAKHVPFSYAHISRMETTDRNPPDRESVAQIAQALGADVDEFLLAAGYAPENQGALIKRPSATDPAPEIPDDTPYPPDEWEIEAVKRLRSADPLDNAYDPTQKRSFWYWPKADRKRRLRSRLEELEEDQGREEGTA